MKRPKFIKPGDTIGFVAPSFGVTTEPYATRFNEAIKKFESRGYKIKIAPSVFKDDGTGISTKPEDAAKDLMDIYLDPEVDAVISVGGGELMNETISFVDFSKLKDSEPKWYMGYSDNTNFIFPNLIFNGIPGIYGPHATNFGKMWEETEISSFDILEGKRFSFQGFDKFESPDYDTEDPVALYNPTEPKILTSYVTDDKGFRKAYDGEPVFAEGILMGGCLDVLINLCGTRFDNTRSFIKEFDKVVWAVEACDLSSLGIRRALWELKEAGWFENASGFIFGKPIAAYDQNAFGVDRFTAITEILKDLHVPLILDVDIGHFDPMVPLVMGSYIKVSAMNNDIQYEMELI